MKAEATLICSLPLPVLSEAPPTESSARALNRTAIAAEAQEPQDSCVDTALQPPSADTFLLGYFSTCG